MKSELLERRSKMLELRAKGWELSDIVSHLAREHECSKQIIYRDWVRRKHWMPKLLELDDRDRLYLDILADHKEISRLATLEFLQGDNSSARVGALRLRRDINKDLFFMLFVNELTERVEKIENKMIQGQPVKGPTSDFPPWKPNDPSYLKVVNSINEKMKE